MYGAKPDEDSRHYILGLPVTSGHLSVIEFLIEIGWDFGGFHFSIECSCLAKAASEGHADITKALIDAGANPNERRKDGVTPLCLEASNGSCSRPDSSRLIQTRPFPDLSCFGRFVSPRSKIGWNLRISPSTH